MNANNSRSPDGIDFTECGLIEPHPHEFRANLIYGAHDLSPWFACDSRVKAGGGSQWGDFTHNGEKWRVRLYYQDSGIVHPGHELPTGTRIEVENIREFRLSVRRNPEEDELGKQKLNAHLSPRWPGIQVETDAGKTRSLSYPEQALGECVNVSVTGSNIGFADYPELLARAAESVGIAGRYFSTPHGLSNVQDASLEVRVRRDDSGPIHSRDGPIARMGHLLETDRSGYRKIVQNDDDERGRNLPGFYHTVTLGPGRVRECWPTHRLPVEIKHYYAREAYEADENAPLAHPKLCVSYQVSRWQETLYWSELDDMESELKRTLYTVLAESGLDVSPQRGTGPYVEDAYWTPGVEAQPEGVHPTTLDLTRIEQDQESVVIRQVADGLSPVEWESLQTLVSDGGTVSPRDIAEEHDRHEDSVRRALRRLEGMVERRYGEVALASDRIAELTLHAVEAAREEAENAVKRAVDASASALEADERGLSGGMGAFMAWAARHGIDVQNQTDARMVLRMGGYHYRETADKIQQGHRLWTKAGLPEGEFRRAQIRFADGSASTVGHWLLESGMTWGHVKHG